MNRLIFVFCITLVISSLSAQENHIFSFIDSEKNITKNQENTRAVKLNRSLLDNIMSNDANNFHFKIPLIDEEF